MIDKAINQLKIKVIKNNSYTEMKTLISYLAS